MGYRTNARIELSLAGTWTDVTGYVYERDPITITRGRAANAQDADPANVSLTLDNRDGRFSPRNPISPYYGILGRNTPIRVSVPAGVTSLAVTEAGGSGATTPHKAALNVTGDLDVRVDVDAVSLRGEFAAKYTISGDQRSWVLLTDGPALQLLWSPDGTLGARVGARSTDALPDRGRVAVRATLDVNNGSGGWTVKFYTAPSLVGPWTQLGDAVTGSSVTSVFAGTAPLEVGDATGISGVVAVPGRFYGLEVRNGIGGSVVAGPDFTTATPGAASYTDPQGNVWSPRGDAQITDRDCRFIGEVSKWPQRWDVSGVDRYVQIQGYGIRRRLTLNAPALHSTMYRAHSDPARTSILAYWPMEDGQGATSIAAGKPGLTPMTFEGSPSLASYSNWTASDPLPEVGNGRFVGMVPAASATGQLAWRMFVYVQEAVAAETSLMYVRTSGPTWDLRLTPSGGLRLLAYDGDGVQIVDQGVAFTLNSIGFCLVGMDTVKNGTGVDWLIRVTDFTNTDTLRDPINTLTFGGTVAGRVVGSAQAVVIGRDRGLGRTIVGHVALANDTTAYTGTASQIAAYNGEYPSDRVSRLCGEESVPVRIAHRGSQGANPARLGDQLNGTLVSLLDEAADTDLGMLTEPRDALGFLYRTRLSMVGQGPGLRLDYSVGEIAGDLSPVDDDEAVINDVTVSRVAGSSYRATQNTGRLSVQPPPAGVGPYATEVDVSMETDAMLPDQAAFRLKLGTVDEVRYPELSVNLHSPRISDALRRDVLRLDLGDRMDLTGFAGLGLPPDDVSQLVQGYTETLRVCEHSIAFNASPASPWRAWNAYINVAPADAPVVDADGSSLVADVPSPDAVPPPVTVAKWSGDGLAAGPMSETTVGTGDRAFANVSAGAFSVVASGGASPRVQMDQAAGSPAQLAWTGLGSRTDYTLSVTAQFSAYPSAGARILNVYGPASAASWYVDVMAGGNLRLRKGDGTTVDTSTPLVPLTGEVRITAVCTAAGAVTVTLSSGTYTVITLAGTGLTVVCDEIRFGNPNSSPTWPRTWLDEMSLAVPGTSTAGTLKVSSQTMWSTMPWDCPFDLRVGGERMTVTAVKDTSITPGGFFATDVDGYIGSGAAVSRDTSVKKFVASLKITPDGTSAAGGARSLLSGVGTITPGVSYTASMWVYSPGGMASVQILVNWFDASGVRIATSSSPAVPLPAGTWVFLDMDFVAPAGATQAAILGWHLGTPAASQTWNIWAAQLWTSAGPWRQTLAVTRAVNGVVKAQTSGTEVHVWDSVYPSY